MTGWLGTARRKVSTLATKTFACRTAVEALAQPRTSRVASDGHLLGNWLLAAWSA